MRLDRRSRRRIRLQNAAFVALVLAAVGLAAGLSHAWRWSADWSQTGRNTLSARSQEILELVEAPVEITAYVGPDAVTRRGIRDLVRRYRRAGARLELDFVNPETNPGVARELGIRSGGEVVLRYQGEEQRLQKLSEEAITGALVRLARAKTRWVVFLQGHGERDPHGKANFDLGRFGSRLQQRGFKVQTLNLATTPYIPDNTDLLVLASPRSDYLPGERARIRQYVQGGGDLLWLTEPGAAERPEPLGEALGIRRAPGVVVDAGAQLYGADTPDFAVIGDYRQHPVVKGLDQVSLFPQAAALTAVAGTGWQHQALLETRARSWTETGAIAGEISQDSSQGERAGPLNLAIAAERGTPAGADQAAAGQRVMVLGDGDFLSNAYIGNGINLDLGMRMVNWLIGADAQVDIPTHGPPGGRLSLSTPALAVLGFGFLIVAPLVLLGLGAGIHYRRRRR
jgi:ABC-type uncharacterized transport system involved in gliding motility auxiliary subunit